MSFLKCEHIPTLLLAQLNTHTLAALPELVSKFGVVGIDHEVLDASKPRTQVLETLALFEVIAHIDMGLLKTVR